MSQFLNDDHELDDHKLVDFLKQHRPSIPAADPALEDRLFDAIAATAQPTSLVDQRSSRSRRSVVWLVPSAIAAGLVATVVGYRTLVPAQPSATELASLEAFVESNWQGTLSNTSDEAPFGDVTTN
jgi:hypothetical protein